MELYNAINELQNNEPDCIIDETMLPLENLQLGDDEDVDNVLTDTIHLDFFSLKLDTLPLPPSLSTTKYTKMQLYIMFVTNDAQSSVSDLALKIIV